MSKVFKSSNGIEIEGGHMLVLRRPKGIAKWSSNLSFNEGSNLDKALAEWYQFRRDQELDRWRDPVTPDHVIYRDASRDDEYGRYVRVVNEATGRTHATWEGSPSTPTTERYFAAHPAPEPLPSEPNGYWLDRDGDVWRTNEDGDLYLQGGGINTPEGFAPYTRLVPEEDSND